MELISDQLLASCLFPFALGHTTMKDEISKTLRTYWDGAFLSNTLLRELIQHHKDFWLSYFDEKGIKYDTRGIEKGIDKYYHYHLQIPNWKD